MPPIHLAIPDKALHNAIAEQLAITKLGEVLEGLAGLAAPPENITAILIDEAALDAKTVKKLQAVKNDALVILLLGAAPSACDETLVREIFAKPLRLGHLMARLRFYLEVAPKLRSAPIAIGDYIFAAQHRSLTRGEDIIRLTEKETALLEYLAQSTSPVGREELLASVWGYDPRIDTHTLETHIYQLRRKLAAELIVNEDGLYRLGA